MTNIAIQHGTEGPRHDPYSYTEITVHRTSPWFQGKVTYHSGLDEWVAVDDCRQKPQAHDCKTPAELFTRLAGIDPDGANRAFYRLRDNRIRHHKCGWQHVEWMSGFPGESLLCCTKCGDILDSRFNRSAVE